MLNKRKWGLVNLTLTSVVLTILSNSKATAHDFKLVNTFNNPTPAQNDRFATAVGVNDNHTIISAPNDKNDYNGVIAAAGSVYVFSDEGNLIRTINNPFLQPFQNFGRSVTIDNDQFVVGAPQDSVSIYDSEGNVRQTIINPTGSGGQLFGNAVDMDGNNFIIGSPGFSARQGRAYLYDGNGNQQQIFDNPITGNFQNFGASVSINGSNVLVKGNNQKAYLFNTEGTLLRTFNNPSDNRPDTSRFGNSVQVSGNTSLIGDPGYAISVGRAYLFDNNTGNILQIFQNPSPQFDSGFGASVAMLGNKVLIGSPGDNRSVAVGGFAYLFDLEGNLLQTFTNPTPEAGDGFGSSLSMFGDSILIGAPNDNTGAPDAGYAYLYQSEIIPEPVTILGTGFIVAFLPMLKKAKR